MIDQSMNENQNSVSEESKRIIRIFGMLNVYLLITLLFIYFLVVFSIYRDFKNNSKLSDPNRILEQFS